jgi:hypothetical protein
MEQAVVLQVKWGADTIMLSVAPMKFERCEEVDNQKIMGWLPKGKTPDDKRKS